VTPAATITPQGARGTEILTPWGLALIRRLARSVVGRPCADPLARPRVQLLYQKLVARRGLEPRHNQPLWLACLKPRGLTLPRCTQACRYRRAGQA
jgi:hypothetical protein